MMMTKASRHQGIKGSGSCASGAVAAPVSALASRRGFTLTELLAAIAIIVVVAGITVVSVRGLAREARLSSATNTVIAALDTGRAMAIRENTLVAVVFRVRPVGDSRQQIEIVTARWTGETPLISVGGDMTPIDRFVPIPGVAARRLPAGISIAGPSYHSTHAGENVDDQWFFTSFLPAVAPAGQPEREPAGRVFAVLFTPDGRVVMRNSQSNSHRIFVDFNNDELQQISGCTICPPDGLDYVEFTGEIPNTPPLYMFNVQMMLQRTGRDEPYLTIVPFFAVYNEDNFREQYEPSDWIGDDGFSSKQEDLTEFVNEHAERIHFNTYTGVVMR